MWIDSSANNDRNGKNFFFSVALAAAVETFAVAVISADYDPSSTLAS